MGRTFPLVDKKATSTFLIIRKSRKREGLSCVSLAISRRIEG
jgi:hypothetical protein